MTEIEVRDSGTNITASIGDRIVVRVPENATTGYQWVVDDVLGPIELESNELIAPENARPGTGSERRVVLRADKGGQARVVLRLQRQWERAPANEFEVVVTVTDSGEREGLYQR